jgi:hypothetical protein
MTGLGIGARPRTGNESARLVAFAAFVVFLLVGLEAIAFVVVFIPTHPDWWLGMDQGFYRDIGARWLADGSLYLPYQLTGPYEFRTMLDVLYPPNALFLFVPFVFLPAALWWAIPIGVLVYVIRSWSPLPWAWLAMAVLLAWPSSIFAYLTGNTTIWAAAALAAGLRWGWPAVFLALKPSLAPFALLVVRRRSFWLGGIAFGLVSLAMLPLWFEYLTAMRNLSVGADYSLHSIPLMLIPVVAWVGRQKTGTMQASPAFALPAPPQKPW